MPPPLRKFLFCIRIEFFVPIERSSAGPRSDRTRNPTGVSEKRNDTLMLQDFTPPEFCDPWKGPQYEGNGLWGRKVLVVGESHYYEWREHKDERPQLSTTTPSRRNAFKDVVNGKGGEVCTRANSMPAMQSSISARRDGRTDHHGHRCRINPHGARRIPYEVRSDVVQVPGGGCRLSVASMER